MASAINKIKDDLSNLNVVLMHYDSKIKGWKEDMRIDRKSYMQANGEQAAFIAYYDHIGDELGVMMADMDNRYKLARTKALRVIQTSSPREYTDKTLNMLIDADPSVVKHYKAFLELKERYEKTCSIVDSFRQRGFSLNNILKSREREFQNEMIYVNE